MMISIRCVAVSTSSGLKFIQWHSSLIFRNKYNIAFSGMHCYGHLSLFLQNDINTLLTIFVAIVLFLRYNKDTIRSWLKRTVTGTDVEKPKKTT